MLEVDRILDRVSGLAEELKLVRLRPQITSCRKQFEARNGIEIAVFGRFKAGKSSFLNHLIGRAVLPIGVVPLTAVITRLTYGRQDRAEVHFLNGSTDSIPLEEIGLYVGENENPNNTKQVSGVDVELPELEPLVPLRFVDTPGLGSAFAQNTETALSWLPNVGAALIAVSSDAPLSERDMALIGDLRPHTPRIVLLLTKADLLTEPQRVEVMDFLRQQMRRKWNEELPVFFYSIHPTLNALRQKLEHQLLRPLIEHRREAAGQIAQHKLTSLVGQTLGYVRVALAAATQADSARTALQRSLAEERQQLNAFREELLVLGNEWAAQALDLSLQRLRPEQRSLEAKVAAALRGQFVQWRQRLPELSQAYRHWLHAFLKGELETVSQTQRSMFCEPLNKTRQHLLLALRAFQDRLARHVKEALGLTLMPHEFQLESPEPEEPPVRVSPEFMVPMDLLGYLIPMLLFRGWIERNLLRRSRYEVEKNLSRLAADWRDRVAAAIVQLNREAAQAAEDELAALEQTVTLTHSKAPELKKAIDDLDEFQNRLRLPLEVSADGHGRGLFLSNDESIMLTSSSIKDEASG
jgi:GTP-binding protein EngB required for normal cell division